MKKISFNQGTLGFDQNHAYYELPRSQVYLNSVEEIGQIRELKQIAFPCTLTLNEEQLEMKFTIEKDYVPLLMFRKSTMDQKLNAAEFLIKIGYFFMNQKELITVFDPLNFFVNTNGEMKILYRGIKGLMPAEGYQDESILDQVKRLLLLLFTSARYDELRIHGLSFAKTKTKAGEKRIVLMILKAEGFPELLGAIQEERRKRQKEEKTVKLEPEEPPFKKWSLIQKFTSLDGKKRILISAGIWVFSLVIAFVLGRSFAPAPPPSYDVTPDFLEGLRQAALQEFDEASKAFKKIDFNQLSKTDQRIVLLSYLFSGQAQTALRLDPNFGEDVANYYSIVDKPEELLKIQSKHPSIRFEQEYAKKNYQAVIQLQNRVTLDKRRRKAIVTAYLELGQVDQAERFVKKFPDSELAKMVNDSKAKK